MSRQEKRSGGRGLRVGVGGGDGSQEEGSWVGRTGRAPERRAGPRKADPRERRKKSRRSFSLAFILFRSRDMGCGGI
jgi:hypothetical protein